MKITFDILFSNWVFIWFLLFCFGLIKYNPFFIFILLFIMCNSWILYAYYTNKLNNYNLNKILILNFLFKIMPILILILTKNYKINNDDIIFTIVLVLIYLVYLHINNLNVIDVYRIVLEGIISGNEHSKGCVGNLYDAIYKKVHFHIN